MCENLGPLLEFVVRGFSDPDLKVKEAACICIGQFAGIFPLIVAIFSRSSICLLQYTAHLLPDIADHHEKVLPMLIACLHDQNRDVLIKACYAVEAFATSLGTYSFKSLSHI